MRQFLIVQAGFYMAFSACSLGLARPGEQMLVAYLAIAMICWILISATAARTFTLLVRASLDDRAAWRVSTRTMGMATACGTIASLALALAVAGPSPTDAIWGCAASVCWTVLVLRVCSRRDYAGLCARCQYDLRGTLCSQACPECGTPLRSVPAHTAEPEEDYRTPTASPT